MIEEIQSPIPPQDIFASIKDRPYPFFLDSSSSDGRLGRFSFLGCDPFLIFSSKKDRIRIERPSGKPETFTANPFLALKSILKRYGREPEKGKIPFTGGAVGYFAYDLKDFVEELPDIALDDLAIPDCMLAFYDSVIAYDHTSGKAYHAGNGRKIRFRIPAGITAARKASLSRIRSNFSKEAYLNAIEKAKSYIKKGDIYQVNLSQRFEADLDIDPADLYSRLRAVSPAPFSSYLGFKDVVIASSSPERFLLKRGSYIETRPIKGTRPRGKSQAEDRAFSEELVRSRKDRAEHIMIVDLERNDLGSVCEYSSVRPKETFKLERYANVFHLVSTVTGRLKENVDPVDCLLAAFPGGSITGAPKIRSMEIIEELEPVKRSVYTGAIGYISFDGDMDTSIAIRTFVIKGKKAYFQVGGGIVADSVPELEYEETLHKAKGMMAALGVERESKVLNFAL